MKPAPFAYHAPETVTDAAGLLMEHGDDAKVLAGGQSLLPMLALRLTAFAHLVDLGGVGEMAGVDMDDPTSVRIGAMTRQRVLERDESLAAAAPLLAMAAPLIGHFQIRNRGTLGGSLAHADPASELPAVAVALGAVFDIAGPGGARRSVAAPDFFVGTWTTALAPDELLLAVRFPVAAPQRRCGDAIAEVARREGDFAIAGAAAHVEIDAQDRIEEFALAMFGVGPTPVAALTARIAARGHTVHDLDVAELARLAVTEIDPSDDVHATGEQRRRIATHLAERVVRDAFAGATR